MNCIEISNLTKTYGSKTIALDGLNLAVQCGKIVGFLGPNGAGKSTTINILAGTVRKDSGDVEIFGNQVGNNDYEFKRRIGFVLESPIYFDKLSANEYLRFLASMYGIGQKDARSRAEELIEFFDLTDRQNDWIEKYSAGMKRRVSLAAALVHKPELLILDEPLDGIDPIMAKRIKNLLRDFAGNNGTILISSHNLDTVERICDEVAIVYKGKLVFQSRTEDIRNRVKDDVTNETYQSLEEIFIDVVSDDGERKEKKKLSWL